MDLANPPDDISASLMVELFMSLYVTTAEYSWSPARAAPCANKPRDVKRGRLYSHCRRTSFELTTLDAAQLGTLNLVSRLELLDIICRGFTLGSRSCPRTGERLTSFSSHHIYRHR
jgi:hypothetical protein